MSGLVDYRLVKREFIAGGAAGGIGIFLGFPIDLIKTNLQINPQKYTSALQCFRDIVRTEGVYGLYKGCIPPVMMQGLINSLIFTGESVATKMLEPDLLPGQVPNSTNAFLAGSFGGLVQCVILVPSEVIKCTMQAGTLPALNEVPANSGLLTPFIPTYKTVQHIVRTEGFMGLYKGLGVTCFQQIPAIGTYFVSYKYIRGHIHARQGGGPGTPVSTAATLTAGALAGAISWIAIYPIDVIKTNMQTSVSAGGRYQGKNFLGVGAALLRERGPGVFYRGLSTAVVRAMPVNAAIFYIYEKIRASRYMQG